MSENPRDDFVGRLMALNIATLYLLEAESRRNPNFGQDMRNSFDRILGAFTFTPVGTMNSGTLASTRQAFHELIEVAEADTKQRAAQAPSKRARTSLRGRLLDWLESGE